MYDPAQPKESIDVVLERGLIGCRPKPSTPQEPPGFGPCAPLRRVSSIRLPVAMSMIGAVDPKLTLTPASR